jgi:hypothetical protein
MHYYRLRRTGSLDRKPPAGPYIQSAGYVVERAPDHPLAKRGRVYAHRRVFYDAHGAGPFACNWCGTSVGWDSMHVDHVNGTKADNRVENLVASCAQCNQARGMVKMVDTARRTRGTQLTVGGITRPAAAWAEDLGITTVSLKARLARGWSAEAAVSTPRGHSGPIRRRGGARASAQQRVSRLESGRL